MKLKISLEVDAVTGAELVTVLHSVANLLHRRPDKFFTRAEILVTGEVPGRSAWSLHGTAPSPMETAGAEATPVQQEQEAGAAA